MKLNDLHDVLVDELRDLYSAEWQLIRALPRMAKAAHSTPLRDALQDHLSTTEGHAARLEAVFRDLELSAKGRVCRGIKGILAEGREVAAARRRSSPEAVDAALVIAAQKVQHYEICAYGSCRAHARTLGLSFVASMLQQTLEEERSANQRLTVIAESGINAAAAAPHPGPSTNGNGHAYRNGHGNGNGHSGGHHNGNGHRATAMMVQQSLGGAALLVPCELIDDGDLYDSEA